MKTIQQNILKANSGFIFHQVNCLGVMGAGLAASIANLYPHVEEHYIDYCRVKSAKREPLLGDYLVSYPKGGLKIVNIFGQATTGKVVQTSYEAVDSSFHSFTKDYEKQLKKESLYFPALMGCGLAGGDPKIYQEIIKKYFGRYDLILVEYTPLPKTNHIFNAKLDADFKL